LLFALQTLTYCCDLLICKQDMLRYLMNWKLSTAYSYGYYRASRCRLAKFQLCQTVSMVYTLSQEQWNVFWRYRIMWRIYSHLLFKTFKSQAGRYSSSSARRRFHPSGSGL